MVIVIYVIIGICFLGLLFSNIYFRQKMMKHFKKLTKQEVVFGALDVFNAQTMDEVKSRHPQEIDTIDAFVNTLKLSIKIILGIITIIILCGVILYNI